MTATPLAATSTAVAAVPDDAHGPTVEVTRSLTHQCPHKNETDYGEITLTWPVNGATLELHDLVEYLDGWTGQHITHEALTDQIWRDVGEAGIEGLTVETRWVTAGAKVTVRRSA